MYNPAAVGKPYTMSDSGGSALLAKASGFLGLQGVLCSSSSSLIIQVWDTLTNDSGAGAVLVQDQLTLTAGQSYPMPARILQGLYVKIVSGTGKFTVYTSN